MSRLIAANRAGATVGEEQRSSVASALERDTVSQSMRQSNRFAVSFADHLLDGTGPAKRAHREFRTLVERLLTTEDARTTGPLTGWQGPDRSPSYNLT